MSAMGHKRTFGIFRLMSALLPKADIVPRRSDARFVPKADACTAKNSWLEAALVQAGELLINHIAPGRHTLAPFA
jgi:hypothetical protein